MSKQDKYNTIYDEINTLSNKAFSDDWRSRRKLIKIERKGNVKRRSYPSQGELALMCGLSVTTYCSLENGMTKPSRHTFYQVMKVFDKHGV